MDAKKKGGAEENTGEGRGQVGQHREVT